MKAITSGPRQGAGRRARNRRRSRGTAPQRKPLGKLEQLPDDQLTQAVAWLLAGVTYREISKRVRRRFGVICSLNAVRTLWLRYGKREEEMREERVIRQARLFLSEPT